MAATAVSPAAHAADNKAEPLYYGLYLGAAKLGSAVITHDDHALRDGKPAVEAHTDITMDLAAYGTPTKVVTSSVEWTDAKTGAPLASRDRVESSGRVTTVSAVYTARSVIYYAVIDGAVTKGTLTLAPGEHFLVDPSDGANMKPKVGLKVSGKIFSAETQKLMDGTVEVLGRETIAVDGQPVSAFKVQETNPLAPTTEWTDDDGNLLRIDLPLHIQMLRQPKDVALAGPKSGGAPPDIADAAAVVPTGAPLTAEARKASEIRYELSGASRPLPASDPVQTVTAAATDSPAAGTPPPLDLTIHARPLPDAASGGTSPARFARADAAPPRLRPYLAPTPYVNSDDPVFARRAANAIGGEKGIAAASERLEKYVHEAIKYDPSITALRSARDVVADPRGVCRDYATLFATLARAAGIPTKVCVGLGYGEGPDGTARFYGHAWDEVWVGTDASGNDRWIALDPTWGTPYADATHIKLSEGDITSFFAVASDLGSYRVKVLEIK